MNIPFDPQQGTAFLIAVFFMPVIVAIIKQSGFSAQVNSVIALVVYIVFGALAIVFAGIPLTLENAAPVAAVAIVGGRAAYSMFWSLIGGDDVGNGSIDDRITEATSIVK